jgi:hypothetical protein
MEIHNTYRTEDIVLAASLRCHGYPLMSIDRSGNSTKGIFVFGDVKDEFIRDYDLGKITVEPIAFNNNIKQLTTSVRRMV